MEYQQIAAGWFLSRVQYGCPVIFVVGCCGTVRVGGCPVFVFGTLLGPEATGPSGGVRGLCGLRGFSWRVWVFLVSWLHGLRACTAVPFRGWLWCGGVWYGVVV